MNDLNSVQNIETSLIYSLNLISDSTIENEKVRVHLLSIIHKCFMAEIVLHLERSIDTQSWKANHKYPQAQIDLSTYASELLETCELAYQTDTKQTKQVDETRVLHVLPLDKGSFAKRSTALAWVEIKSITSGMQPAQRTMMEFAIRDLGGKSNQTLVDNLTDQPLRLSNDKVISIVYQLCSKNSFLESCFFLCNSLAAHLASNRVSLGIFVRKRISLKAISQSANFDRRSSLAQDLINAMEESADQDLVITYPSEQMDFYIYRQHKIFSRNHGNQSVVSIPIRGLKDTLGVLTLEFNGNNPNDKELKQIEFLVTTLGPVLERSLNSSRPFVIQLFYKLISLTTWLFGPRKIAAKLFAIAGLITFSTLFAVETNHRIDTKATIRAVHAIIIPAPFDGFLSNVYVELGSSVRKDDKLVEMDIRELIQEEKVAVAETARHQTEIERSLATGKFAELQIARAQLAQSQAKLDLVRFRMASAQIRAPRNGIVVEGDLTQALGSPVKRGDMLMRLADTDELYLELEINQNDMHFLNDDLSGELLVAGRPDERIPFTLTSIDPIAQVKNGSNVFVAKGKFETDKKIWWRPGMGGTAKIKTGSQPLIWSMTYRTINFIRKLLWL